MAQVIATNKSKVYPGSDSSTWPANGTLWKWVYPYSAPLYLCEDTRTMRQLQVREGELVFLAKVIYCTKDTITCNFIFNGTIVIWAFSTQTWNKYFELVEL